jgi:hypothetical protein
MPHISNKEFSDTIEKDILALFKTFNDKTGYFLSESDVQSYLYSLLINDPNLKTKPILDNFATPNIETPETLLVHADAKVKITRMKGTRKVDLMIFPPRKTIDYSGEFEDSIGIEIKFNRRIPARKEHSGILDDIKKCADYKQGYVLWLNYDREISDNHLRIVRNRINECGNVKLFYLDVYSNPIKTNVPDL